MVRVHNRPQSQTLIQSNMRKQQSMETAKKQLRQKFRYLAASVLRLQMATDQAMEQAQSTMSAEEIETCDAYRVMENLSCVCEETLEVLNEEIKRKRYEKTDIDRQG